MDAPRRHRTVNVMPIALHAAILSTIGAGAIASALFVAKALRDIERRLTRVETILTLQAKKE